MLRRAVNLSTLEERFYSKDMMTEKETVICAYAQGTKNDYNTWDYQKYSSLVEVGEKCVTCGDWCVLLDWR